MVLSYSEARAKLDSARSREAGRPIGNNTRLHMDRDSNSIAVRLHATDVVMIHPDGTYTLNSGGWRTVTTKARLNEHSPARVYSERGKWYVWGDYNTGERWPFYDGITVDGSGCPIGAPPPAAEAEIAARQRYHKEARKYIRGFLKHLETLDAVPLPSNGDCWGCLFVARNQPDKAAMGWDHIWSHFEEEYYVPSLLYRAFMENNPAGGQWFSFDLSYQRGKPDLYWAETNLRAYFRRHERDICAAAPELVHKSLANSLRARYCSE